MFILLYFLFQQLSIFLVSFLTQNLLSSFNCLHNLGTKKIIKKYHLTFHPYFWLSCIICNATLFFFFYIKETWETWHSLIKYKILQKEEYWAGRWLSEWEYSHQFWHPEWKKRAELIATNIPLTLHMCHVKLENPQHKKIQ